MKKKILMILGTRPEAVKMCPLAKELETREAWEVQICLTGQHRDLVAGVLDLFELHADTNLGVMREGQDLLDLNRALLAGLKEVLARERPHLVLVHGDTTTAFCAALACFYLRIPVGHVEAGLRTYDLSAPFPEEWNRRAISLLASLHFAPTLRAQGQLVREGIDPARILVTGNTAIDALRTTVRPAYAHSALQWAEGSRLLLLTAHRRESLGEPMRRAFRGIRRIVEEFEDVKVLYPVHPNPAVRAIAEEVLGGVDRIRLVEPLDPLAFHNVLAACYLVLTDSGGVQEEAPALDKPVLILRRTTERPEGLEAGVARLIGTGTESVYRGVRELLRTPALYDTMARAKNPYGDGYASRRIADYLEGAWV